MDLGKRLREALRKFTGKSVIDEKAVKELIKELQRTLIAADVNVKIVLDLSKRIEKRALESEKLEGISIREHVVKVVYDELVKFLGETYKPRLEPHRILLVGLYGSGKTTTAAKLAKFYRDKGLRPALIAADTERPAAREQLKQLAKSIGVAFYTNFNENKPWKIVEEALEKSKEDIIIIDSAGRNALDEELKKELKRIYDIAKPDEVFLVLSADIGQIAGKHAKAFSEAIPITGIIITKIDGTGKGGGALAAVAQTGAKISFIGTGEKLDDIEVYSSKRYVSRLLGMPDIEGLLEKINKIKIDRDKIESEEFNFETFYEQLKAAKSMGPLSSITSMVGMPDLPKEALNKGEEQLKMMEAMINSMTPEERKNPDIVRKSSSRVARIAKGAGISETTVRALIRQFFQMKKLYNQLRHNRGLKGKLAKFMKFR